MNAKWSLTKEAFDSFLEALGPDREAAAARHPAQRLGAHPPFERFRFLIDLHGVGKHFDQAVAEQAALDIRLHLPDRIVEPERAAIRPRRRQRIEHVHDGDDLREQRNLVASQAVGIPRSIQPLVVMANDSIS